MKRLIGMSTKEVSEDVLVQVATNPAAIRVLNYLPALFATVFEDVGLPGLNKQRKSGMYYACGVALANVWNSGRAVYSKQVCFAKVLVVFGLANRQLKLGCDVFAGSSGLQEKLAGGKNNQVRGRLTPRG